MARELFSSLPKPHGNRGIDEPYWQLRQCPIILDDCFRGHGVRRLYTTAIPSPDKLERRRLREQVQMEGAGGCTQAKSSLNLPWNMPGSKQCSTPRQRLSWLSMAKYLILRIWTKTARPHRLHRQLC